MTRKNVQFQVHNGWTMPHRIILVLVLFGLMFLFTCSFRGSKNQCTVSMLPSPPQHVYTQVRHHDIVGYDLMHVQAQDLNDVKKVCDLFPKCAGFNSNGWLKTKVSAHVPGPADLYVKSAMAQPQEIVEMPMISSDTLSNSYEEMLAKMKIYVYEISTGTSILRHYRHDLERHITSELSRSHFRTRKPEEAIFFFIPIRCSYYMRGSASEQEGILKAKEHVAETIELIKRNYPYWDRAAGSDHFYVCAHSIGASVGGTLLKNSIALVHSADYESPYFIPHKDISLPPNPTHTSVFKSPSKRKSFISLPRPVLAFFAGDMNSGRIRPTLYSLFASDISIVLFLQDVSWNVRLKYLSQSKFCLVVRGKDVWSSDLIDAVMASCVPVIISDHYHLPLQGIINWNEFSILIPESQISSLKNILLQVSSVQYKGYQEKLLEVQSRFIWNEPAKPYDAFYSVVFELWQRRDVVRYRRK